MNMKKKGKSFVKGAVILMIFGLVSKVVGAVYRLPLTSIITAEGMGLYQLVFPIYTLMLTISSSGLPSSISKLISENLAKRKYKQADKILKISFVLLVSFSVVCAALVVVLSEIFAKVQGNENAAICYLGIAPAIVFVGLISGFRGYFQGQENMMPSAASGFIEQFVKLFAGLFFARKFMSKSIAYAVFGAMLGITLSEFVAFLYLLITFIIYRKKHKNEYDKSEIVFSNKMALRAVVSTSFFITLGGLVMPLGMMIDSVIIINVLQSSGYSVASSTVLFGLQSGTVGSIVNMPVVISLALATAILPRVSAKWASGDYVGMSDDASKAILFAVMLALPASFGCMGLAEPIIKLLYRSSLSPEQLAVAVKLLEVASITIFYLALVQVTAGILQGIGLVWVPLVSLSVGMVTKIVLDLVLVRILSVGILGAEVASGVCYLLALLINLSILKAKKVIKLSFKAVFLLATAVMTYCSKWLFNLLLQTNLNYYLSFFTTIFMVILLYGIFVFMLYRSEIFKRNAKI